MARVLRTASASIVLLAFTAAAPVLADPGGDIMTKQIRLMFERFDSNGDGRIGMDEFNDVHMIRFYTLDMDNDGEIFHEEFVFMRGMRGVPGDRADEAFERLDSDGNGRVTVREFDASRGSTFATLDLNGDGDLSQVEVSQVASSK